MVQTVNALIERVRQEPGCLSSELYQDLNKDKALCLLEEWATEAYLDTHLTSENFGILRGAVKALHTDVEMKSYAPSERTWP